MGIHTFTVKRPEILEKVGLRKMHAYSIIRTENCPHNAVEYQKYVYLQVSFIWKIEPVK